MKGSKVLLIEDTPDLVSVILRGLSEEGIEISVAADGVTGLEMAFKYDFDLIVLDIMLPVMNGIQVCKEIRKRNTDVAILMLTALGSTENIVTGLESGADDYLVKPFKLEELVARMRTLIRRSSKQAAVTDRISIADLEINIASKTVTKTGKPVNLTATEYRLLEYLLKNHNKVLSRIQILENVWDIDFNLGTNVVDVYINYLRKKIDNVNGGRLIHTVFGMGYILKE
ncbi:response regulator transcription factor [Pedobacter heparinus]|uniref:Response regulator receiver n=1 Tax=Pedobacter heparinus (strain ATCC 13125 / DSM 2366 / CIP 104194 / JCM 7457 / NBRC 12017 / NCIMB 9290 / NRRL B-14731 / HIM 762-3) TaxID=485917 RepID=C6XU71_PEDHD|nr:response regulator transcription factor [Pedobacter heparinus]ACU05864.1 response regulator receiver [Pedobacter heparinus DSM 2366]